MMTENVDNSGARRLIVGGAWFLGLMVLSGVFWLLLGVQISRAYGPSGYGLFNIAQSVFDFMWAFVFGGLFEGLIHFGAGYLTKKKSNISSYFSNYVRYFTIMSLILFCVLIVLSFQTTDIILSTILISIAVAFLFSGTKDALSAIVGSLHKNKQLSIINSSGFYLVSILGMIFIMLNLPLHLLPILIIFAPVCQLLFCMYFLRAYLKDLFILGVTFYKNKNIKQSLFDDFKHFKHMLFFGFSISIGKISFMVMKSLDIPVLILFFNYANVGVYSVADTASSVLFSMTAFSLPILSSISEAWAKKDKALVEDYAKISVKYPLILGIPLTVIIFSLADPIVTGIYGTEFQGAVMPLQILIFGTFLLMFGHTLSSILIGIGKPKISGMIMAGAAVQYLISLFVLVPILGFNGAAISLTLTGVTTLGLIPILIRRNLKVDIFSGFYKVLFSGAILAALLYLIRETSPILLFLGIIASIAVYILLLRYTGYLTNEDISLLKAARKAQS
jgi:O-antigen/teichoic acid export membrane protein